METINVNAATITREETDSLIDELTYRNYYWNRKRRPDISADRWAAIYANAEAMEKRYQQEVHN